MMDVVAVIPAYGMPKELECCLLSLWHYYPDCGTVLVVEEDDIETQRFLSNNLQRSLSLFVVQGETRRGYTRAVNAGLDMARRLCPRWIVHLAADAEVKGRFLDEMFEIWAELAWWKQSPMGLLGGEWNPRPDVSRYTYRWEPGAVVAGCLLMSMDILSKECIRFPERKGDYGITEFSDDQLVHYYSQHAFSWLLNRRGYRTVYANKVPVDLSRHRDGIATSPSAMDVGVKDPSKEPGYFQTGGLTK